MRLVINVKTPTFVLSGGRLHIGLDAIVSDNRLYVIDIGRLPVDQLLNMRNIDKQALGVLINTVSKDPRRYSVREYLVFNKCEGVEILDHSIEGIPPSEIKGLMRTTYLHWLLTRDSNLREGFIKSISERLLEGPRLNALSTNAENYVLAVLLERVYGERKYDALYQLFKDLTVKQSSRPQSINYGVYCIHDSNNKFKVMAIGLRPSVRLEYEVMVRYTPVSEDIKGRLLNYNDLIESIKLFSSDITSLERSRRLGIPDCGNGIPMRIGFGVGRRWKTVLNILEKYNPDLVRKVTEYVSGCLSKPWGDSTIRFVNNEPVGWVCIEVIK